MLNSTLAGWSPARLRAWLAAFCIALAVPAGLLIQQAWTQLKWEAYYRHRLIAEETAGRISDAFARLINVEEARPFTDYSFLNVAGDPAANFVQRSPLSALPAAGDLPGLIGYFQVDANSRMSTPLLPEDPRQSLAYGVSDGELQQRVELQERIRGILGDNRLVQARPEVGSAAPVIESTLAAGTEDDLAVVAMDNAAADTETGAGYNAASQRGFDELELRQGKSAASEAPGPDRVDYSARDLVLAREQPAALMDEITRDQDATTLRVLRKEQSALPEPSREMFNTGEPVQDADTEMRISIFESEVDAFELSLLDSGHLVLFRKVWRDGQRYIQGALIDRAGFLDTVIAAALRGSTIASSTDLSVAYAGAVLSSYAAVPAAGAAGSTGGMSGELLLRQFLAAPLEDMELIFSIRSLPPGPGSEVVLWLAVTLVLILGSGSYLLYRLGLGQIQLARQQQDFISAVSHELKTPLTSIRMYGEMLREGWAGEDRKQTYYQYIHEESERLSRLIGNVLQLARMTRNDLQLDLRRLKAGTLLDTVRSRVAALAERAGFELLFECEAVAGQAEVEVDVDSFTQVIINLVDNAIKFSARAVTKRIEVRCRLLAQDRLQVSVRDHGPGIPRGHMKKVFRLFYRPENELTRETVGTGIGLALVKQLLQAMHGSIDVTNLDPGAEFNLVLPVVNGE